MKKTIFYCLVFLSSGANADQLTDQINSFAMVQEQNVATQNARELAAYNAQMAEQKRIEDIALEQQRAERKLQEKALRIKEAAIKAESLRIKEAAAQEAAYKKSLENERLSDKVRVQTQEDEDRAIELELKMAQLQEIKALSLAKAQRANELLDAELAEKKANTDVIQSGADATRNVSEGTKELQAGIGRGVEAEGKSWFK
jgi:hypothetical protein